MSTVKKPIYQHYQEGNLGGDGAPPVVTPHVSQPVTTQAPAPKDPQKYHQEEHNQALKTFLRSSKRKFVWFDYGLALAVVWFIFVQNGLWALGVLVFFGLIMLGYSIEALIDGIAPEKGRSQFTRKQAKRAMFTMGLGIFFLASDGALVAHKAMGYELTGWILQYSLYGTLAQGPLIMLMCVWVYRASEQVKAEEDNVETEAALFRMNSQSVYNEGVLLSKLELERYKLILAASKREAKIGGKYLKEIEDSYRQAAQQNGGEMIRSITGYLMKPLALPEASLPEGEESVNFPRG